MVRNNGGNKAKRFASKSNTFDRNTRFAIEAGEIYAVVQRMLGNNMCEVLGIDAIVRLCVIRGKFSGRGKRDNRIMKGTWILIGLRDWEITSKDKPKCDLLEVYSDADKDKLIRNSKENFRIFFSVIDDNQEIDPDHIRFINEQEELLNDLKVEDSPESLVHTNAENLNKKTSNILGQHDWIDVDDI